MNLVRHYKSATFIALNTTMNSSIDSALQHIIQQEREDDAKLKEKREYEAAVAVGERNLRNELATIARLQKSMEDRIRTSADVNARLETARIRLQARSHQLDAVHQTVEDLTTHAERDVCGVWEQRGELCAAMNSLSEQCGVSALLATRARADIAPRPAALTAQPAPPLQTPAIERLHAAEKRKERLLADRARLQVEPEQAEHFIRRCLQGTNINFRNLSNKVEDAFSEPIKFSTSPAAKRRAVISVRAGPSPMPWYQPFAVTGSVAVFLIYFCILREENDIDMEFDKTLYDRIEGLEKEQLLQSYRFNKEHGKSVEDIERRLKEISAMEESAKN